MKQVSLSHQTMSFLLMSLMLSSCGGSKSSSSESSSETHAKVEEVSEPDEVVVSKDLKHSVKRLTELEADFSNSLKFKRDINTYTIQAKSNTRSFPDGELVCSKLLFDQNLNLFSARFDDRGEHASLNIEISKSDPLKVDFNCYVKLNGKLSNAFVISLKKSFFITDEQSLNSAGIGSADEIDTLFLDKDAVLTTEGKKLKLNVNELISAGAKITTFKDETLKEQLKDVNGEDGGEIDLNINKASGTLTINMRGRDAGIQTRKRTQKLALQADPALNGQCRDGSPRKDDVRCFGKDGQNGFDGEPGYPGFDGGRTGKLKLNINHSQLLNFKIEFNPGFASIATLPTNPTDGQPGGIGSHVKWRRGGCSDHVGGHGGGKSFSPQKISDGLEFAEVNGYGKNNTKLNNSGLGKVTQQIDEKNMFCDSYDHKFPNGKKGAPGKPVPSELMAKDGIPGSIEPAELTINNKTYSIETNWSSEEL